jgi:5-methylcytosine-specific restriction endonuclease McrA
MSLRTENPPMLPKLNRKRALFVLTKIDEILAWEQRKEAERDTRFVELGRYLCEVRAGQYWRLENLKSFDEFLERRFPESRRKAYYLMSIHEHLPPQAKRELKAVGWTKGLELAKLARAEGQHFDCATWLHKARAMPKEEFKREVEKELTGRETEPWEIIYFKLYKSQIPVIEQAIETAALMLGSGQITGVLPGDDLRRLSRGGNPGQRQSRPTSALDLTVLQVPSRRAKASVRGTGYRESVMNGVRPKCPRLRLEREPYEGLRQQVLRRDGWKCQCCGTLSNLEVHHKEFRSHSGDDTEQNLITLCDSCHAGAHGSSDSAAGRS